MTLTVAYPSGLFAQPMTYPRKPPEGFLAIPVTLSFTGGSGASVITGYTLNLANAGAQQGSGFSQVSTVFIDNSNSPGDTVVSVVGTPQTISARPFTRGYYPVNGANLNLVVTNNSPVLCTVGFVAYNYIVDPLVDQQNNSIIGDGDAIIASRVGNLSRIMEFGTMAAAGVIQVGTIFGSVTTELPYWYLTGITVSAYCTGSGTDYTTLRFGNYNLSSQVIDSYLFDCIISQGMTIPQIVFNQQGMCISGTGDLGCGQVLACPGMVLAVTLFGGRSATPLTGLQFNTVG
jgi:hypothetical protein